MGWKENRRRKRIWYKHYKGLAQRLLLLMEQGEFCPEAVLEIFFDHYEMRRMHGKKFIAASAYESLRLACNDIGLNSRALRSINYFGRDARPADMPGQLRPPAEEPARTTPEELGELEALLSNYTPSQVRQVLEGTRRESRRRRYDYDVETRPGSVYEFPIRRDVSVRDVPPGGLPPELERLGGGEGVRPGPVNDVPTPEAVQRGTLGMIQFDNPPGPGDVVGPPLTPDSEGDVTF